MTIAPLSPVSARRRFLALSVTRWFPVGLTIGILTLWPIERGLSVAQALTALSFAGVVVFFLELPTSGFADAFGRRPVFLTAAVLGVVSTSALLLADSFWTFALASALTGLFRAVDSGPLEAWFVDTVHETEPGADVDQALSAEGTVIGVAIASGSLVCAGLVLWHPVASSSALMLPIVVGVAVNVVHLSAGAVLMQENRARPVGSGVRRALDSAREAPRVIRSGLGLLRTSAVLRGLVLVQAFWAVAMVVFETFQPVRLAELLGSEARAGVWMGVIAAGGWGVVALGSTLAGLASTRIGVARTAMLARVLNGCGAVAMGLVAGPIALVAAYLLTYCLHGTGGPMHGALLHREASERNRATVLSINSMIMFAAYSIAAPLLGLLAERTSNQSAMLTAGAISILGTLCYLPARRAERATAVAPN
ncbi:MAG: MFS transporter [Dermatophilaceae bacterium]